MHHDIVGQAYRYKLNHGLDESRHTLYQLYKNKRIEEMSPVAWEDDRTVCGSETANARKTSPGVYFKRTFILSKCFNCRKLAKNGAT